MNAGDQTLLHGSDDGVFGISEVVRDFDPGELDTLREVARAIRTPEAEDVTSAIALAGSAAQSKFQLFPGDCDYFERVHIRAATREEALAILTSCMLRTVANVFPHGALQFAEMKLGVHAFDCTKDGGEVVRAGTPISWTLPELDARSMTVTDAEGEARRIVLGDSDDPGFVKLDWVHADAKRDRLVAVSKVIDATWETPEGSIVPLDGVIDSFYQEVYLDDETRPFVEELIDRVSPAGLGDYVGQLEKEIRKYTAEGSENYGKVAKRLYNIFRITHRPEQAEHLREMFDEPAAQLYQVPAKLYALGQVLGGVRLDAAVVQAQVDELEEILARCYERDDCDDLVAAVDALPDTPQGERQAVIDRVSDAATDAVSDWFHAELERDPVVAEYLASLRG